MSDIINPTGKDIVSVSTTFCGRELSLEVNRLAFRSKASVIARVGDTVVLATANVGGVNEHLDYFPLSIEYEERLYAAGKISGSRFIKREGRPSDDAILTGRLIDRPIRPLFPKGFRNETQVVTTVLSLDPEVRPDTVAMIAASAALTITGAPFDGPLAGVRIGLVEGELVAYPDTSKLHEADLDIMVACVEGGVMMVEAGANEASEEHIVGAFELAMNESKSAIQLQKDLATKLGVQSMEYDLTLPAEEIIEEVSAWAKPHMGAKLRGDYMHRKQGIEDLYTLIDEELGAKLGEEAWAELGSDYKEALGMAIDKDVRTGIVEDNTRPDGRKLDEVRPLSSQVGLLPRTHGSSVFTRGMTQALNITTLAPLSYAQIVDTMEKDEERRYMHHFNAPGYTLGEVRRMGGPGRREIGHGYLAERALAPMIPSAEKFPYTIRTVTEIMSQHGSTSMAATCSSCLSLMDAGVPIKRPVSGIAMGLIVKDDGTPIVLTDIQDAEDFAGDMDFKVTGTSEGVTALQMDMKVHGLPVSTLAAALEASKAGRAHILDHMLTILESPRKELSEHAPRVETVIIKPEQIKEVIGKGGETIQGIIAESGAEIDIKDDGQVLIFCDNVEGMAKAKQMIADLTTEPEVGTVYRDRPVVKVMDFGAFVNLMPGKDGMVHVSEMADERVGHPSDVVSEGDKVDVKLLAIDDRGRLNLSMKAARD